MLFALKITEENLNTIENWNDGETPDESCVADGDYIITWTSPHLMNLIRSEEDFRADFEFVDEELPNEFSQVREL